MLGSYNVVILHCLVLLIGYIVSYLDLALSSNISYPILRSWYYVFIQSGEMEEEMENPEMVDLPEKQKHQLRHRELFLSRQLESLPATHIRYN